MNWGNAEGRSLAYGISSATAGKEVLPARSDSKWVVTNVVVSSLLTGTPGIWLGHGTKTTATPLLGPFYVSRTGLPAFSTGPIHLEIPKGKALNVFTSAVGQRGYYAIEHYLFI